MGSAGTELARQAEADYEDGISEAAGADRLSAREISNIVFDQEESALSSQGLSNLVWQWGQFIDHDITLTGHSEDESLDIPVSTGDEHFDRFASGEQVILFTRSTVAEGTGVDSAARRQVIAGAMKRLVQPVPLNAWQSIETVSILPISTSMKDVNGREA